MGALFRTGTPTLLLLFLLGCRTGFHSSQPQPTPVAYYSPEPGPSGLAGCSGGKLVDAKAYFFQLIHREEGSPALDWAEVLDQSGLPAGPASGIRIPDDAPFYGLTQQRNTAGEVRGRIFLPAGEPDSYGYFVHGIDVLDGDPLVWRWNDHLGGPPYQPKSCP